MVSIDLRENLDLGPYIQIADENLNLISIFDDLRYDRSDADILSPAMRVHAVKQLGAIGFKQKSGTVLVHSDLDVRCLIPKFHALGASPFDVTRYTPRREQDFYVLTPTQTACQFIDNYALEDAVERTRALIAKQPINLYRLMDYLERKPTHQDFLQAIGHLKYVQRTAVSSEPLCRRRPLG
ncbi:MAG: hypothetical protein AAGB11_15050 [Pseudomonadota bacterium]